MTSIVIIPFSIYMHLLFEHVPSDNLTIFSFKIYHGFQDNRVFVWFFLTKFIPLILCVFWFFTCEYWWRYFILSPIIWHAYSHIRTVFFRSNSSDSALIYSIILVLSLVLLVLIIEFLVINRFKSSRIGFGPIDLHVDKDLYENIKSQLEKLKTKRNIIDDFQYSYRLLYFEKLIKSKKDINRPNLQMVSFLKKFSAFDIFIALSLFFYPLFYNMHQLIPEGLEEVNVLGLTLDNNGFVDVHTYYWFLTNKLGLSILMIIWFYTSKNWWRYAILTPIILYTYQFWEANQDIQHLDAFGNLKAFPAVFSVVFLLVVLSRTFKYKYGLLDIHDNIVKELDIIIKEEAKSSIKEFEDFKNFEGTTGTKPQNGSTTNYLENLYRIKDKIEYHLKTFN